MYQTDNPRDRVIDANAITTKLSFVHDPVTFIHIWERREPIVLDKKFDLKQDYQRSIDFYKRDGGVLKLNHYGFQHQGYNNPSAVGGLDDTMSRTLEDDENAVRVFVQHYGDYINVVKSGDNKGCFQIRWKPNGSAFTLRDRTNDPADRRAKDAGARVKPRVAITTTVTAAPTATATATAPAPTPAPQRYLPPPQQQQQK